MIIWIAILGVVALAGWVGMFMMMRSWKQTERKLNAQEQKMKDYQKDHQMEIKKWELIADNWKELAKRQNMEQLEIKKREDPVVDSVVKQILEEFDKVPVYIVSWTDHYLGGLSDKNDKQNCEKELIRQRIEKLVNWLADKAKATEEKAN